MPLSVITTYSIPPPPQQLHGLGVGGVADEAVHDRGDLPIGDVRAAEAGRAPPWWCELVTMATSPPEAEDSKYFCTLVVNSSRRNWLG